MEVDMIIFHCIHFLKFSKNKNKEKISLYFLFCWLSSSDSHTFLRELPVL